MGDNMNTKKSILSAKTRVIVAALVIVGIAGGVVAIWHQHRKHEANKGAAVVTSGPNISSIPGAGNPSNQYVKMQNLQNMLEAKKARKKGSSAVPTITRPSFIGSPNAFGTLNKKHSNTAKNECPIKKVVVMFKPNPSSCTVANLKLARKTGVTAEELLCQGCSCPALKLAGYTVGDLKNIGFTAKQLRHCGFTLGQLIEAGFGAKQLKNAGYNAKQLANDGFTAGQLAAAGFSPNQIKKAGYTQEQLKAAGISAHCDLAALRKAREKGVSAATLKKEGCGLAALKAAGYSAKQLKAAGFTAAQLKDAGFNAKQLKKAGFSAAQLKKAGYSAAALNNAGYSNSALKAAGFTAAQIKAANKASKMCSVSRLKKERAAGVSAIKLRKEGCGLAALKAAGYTAAELKAAGFTAKQLKNAGFTAAQLKAAGYSAAALKKAGFSAAQLKAAGYSAAALKKAGFTAAQLKAAGYSAAALKKAGFTAEQLKAAGYSAAALKKAGYSAGQLKAAGFSAGQLKAAGFNAKQLKDAGFSAKQLRNAGYNAAALKAAGYTAKQLRHAGFSKGDLLRADFSPKKAGYATSKAASKVKQQQASAASNAAKIASKLNHTIPSVDANSPEARLAEIMRQQQRQMTAQQRQDATQQLQGAMTMQANRMVSEWSHAQAQIMQKANPPKVAPTTNATGIAGSNGSSSAASTGKIIKAGSVMFAVLDTSIDSDEKSPIMATIIAGPLKGSKLLGHFKRINKRLLLSFYLLNDPRYKKSIALDAVAIDPDTARTAVSGQVNNHYLLRYGSLFASAFLSGLSHAIVHSGSTSNCFLGNCTTAYDKLDTNKQILVGLGAVGNKYAQTMHGNFNTPPTIKVKGGVGIGILFMSDLKLPLKPTVTATTTDTTSNQ